METHYPLLEHWLRFLAEPNNCDGLENKAYIGTIADVLQLSEECKKGNGQMALSAFEERFAALVGGRVSKEGFLLVLDLNKDSLVEAAFTGPAHGDDAAVDIWPEIAITTIPPWRTLRRLVLRPHENRWWGTPPYDQMEEHFQNEQTSHG